MATRPFSQMDSDMKAAANNIVKAFNTTAPQAVGVILMNGFKKSFDLQQFNDDGADKWQEVVRRKPTSKWYKKGSAGSTRRILTGTGSLQRSIYVKSARAGRVVIGMPKPYAQVHNEGGYAKIYGKKSFAMPKRQFAGHSNRLDRENKQVLDKIINRAMP